MSSDSELAKYSNDTDGMMKLLLDLSENQADLKKQLLDTTKDIEERFSLKIENAIKEIKLDTSLQIQNAAKNIILDTNLNIIKAQESTLAFMKELKEENSTTVMTHSAMARKELREVEASLNRKINTVNDNLKILIDEEVVRSTEAEMKIDKLSSKRFQDIEASWSKNIDVLAVVLDSIEDYNAFKVVISEKLYSKSNDPQVSIDSSNENKLLYNKIKFY